MDLCKEKANGLYFYKGHDEVKDGQPNYARTYVFHMLGIYVAILCNWLIFWQNAFYLYLGRSRMYLMLQEIRFQVQVLKPCKSVQESNVKSVVH